MSVLSCVVLLAFKCKVLVPLVCTIHPSLPLKRDSRPLSKPQLHRIQALVDTRIGEALPIARLALELGMSPSHFSHRFKAAVGITPHLFVLRRKMWTAARLLAERNRSLEEVASEVGFSNMRHFRRQFRKYVGCSPSDPCTVVASGSADDGVRQACKESSEPQRLLERRHD